MAHLRYTGTAELADPERAPLVARVVAERGELLHLYQMLLHSPPLAEGWLHYLTHVRQRLDLPGDLRELVIMQVAHLNGAPYEAAQHAPIARREGVPAPALDALPRWRDAPDRFTPAQQLALALADTMTRQVQVPAAQMQAVRDALGERQAVELVGVIAAYNMVSRFLEALAIHHDDAREPPPG
ncbi:MAG: carboxymuconolactone decarboxylase family protein [Burkholderiaceae bacterium]|nr:carboxymuconolactone decarboxylase family protein [Burkholderiaceae bacterium]